MRHCYEAHKKDRYLVDMVCIRTVNLDRMRRNLCVQRECAVEMNVDKFRVDTPFREDSIYIKRIRIHPESDEEITNQE